MTIPELIAKIKELDGECIKCVEQVIRLAQNEALERAAKVAKSCAENWNWTGTYAARQIAAAIRAMKE